MATFFDEVTAATEQSAKSSTRHQPGYYHAPEATGLFGRDGGADYARYIFESVEYFIREESKRKCLALTFVPPVSGPSARDGFLDELKVLLPGFAIEWKGHEIEIRWANSSVNRVQQG
jgi:hypothetical protein